MSLLQKNMEWLSVLKKTESDDELGGYHLSYEATKRFKAAITIDRDNTQISADRSQLDPIYKITTTRQEELLFHDVIQKENTGECMRIISTGDKKTPKGAGLDMRVYLAEPYDLEKGEENDE